jgi:hypothetical protein
MVVLLQAPRPKETAAVTSIKDVLLAEMMTSQILEVGGEFGSIN